MKNGDTFDYKRYFCIGAIFAFSACDLIPTGSGAYCNRKCDCNRTSNCNAITSKIGLVMMMFSTKSGLIAGGLLALSAWAHAAPVSLITNGDFESGLAGWTVADLAGGSGSWFTIAPGANAPTSGISTSGSGGSAHGNQIAVTDQTGPGTHSLLQSFTVAPGATNVKLIFDMFVNNYGGGPFCGPGLDHTNSAVECGRVDILSSAAGAFDTGGGVLANLYLGSDSAINPNPFMTYTIDITSIVGAGGNFQLRFAESDNQGFFNQGVDNVSLTADASVPEPSTIALIGLALFGLRFGRRNKA